MTGSQLPEPVAQGDLSRTPFAHILLYARSHALGGTLVVWQPEGEERPKQDRILFERGRPTAGRLLERASRLDRGMLPLFARASGPYAFYGDVDLVGSGEGVRRESIDVLALIAASLRGSSRDDVVAQVCAGLGDARLRVEPGLDAGALGLLPQERALVEVLRAEPMTVARLAEISPLPPRMAQRLVYFLAITKSVAPWDGELPPRRSSTPPRAVTRPPSQRPASPPAEPPTADPPDGPPPPPPGLSGAHRATWEEVAARAVAIDGENCFEMLGLSRDAPASAAGAAYFGLVKKWHPDRMPRELAPLKPFVETIFRHLTAAHETLSDDTRRGAYLATVQDGGGTPAADRQLARIVHAAMEFRKVEVHLKRRELSQALALVDEVIELNAEEPDYHAARGWILFQQNPTDRAQRSLVHASLDRALALNDKHDKALFYKGCVLELDGDQPQATELFRRAAEVNPKNIEAVRKVRIATMRNARDDGSAPSGGGARDSIFNKIFGKK